MRIRVVNHIRDANTVADRMDALGEMRALIWAKLLIFMDLLKINLEI